MAADAATLQANITFEPAVVADTATDGLTATVTNRGGNSRPDGSILYAESKATAASLHAYSIGGGSGAITHPRFQANATITVDDVVFTSASGDSTPFSVSLRGTVEGEFSKVALEDTTLALGPAYIIAQMSSGNLYDSRGTLLEAAKRSELRFETGLDGVVDGDGPVSGAMTHSFLAISGQKRRISLSLTTEASGFFLNGKLYGSAADASRSFHIDPSGVFDLPEGVTASSESWGLVDNKLPYLLSGPAPSAVPLPAGMPLLLAGLGLLGVVRRRK